MNHTIRNIAVFASGNGSNFEAIVRACKENKIEGATVSLLVCDRYDAYALERAKKLDIKPFVFDPKSYSSKKEYEQNILDVLRANDIHIICLAGYMLIRGFSKSNIEYSSVAFTVFQGGYSYNRGFRIWGKSVWSYSAPDRQHYRWWNYNSAKSIRISRRLTRRGRTPNTRNRIPTLSRSNKYVVINDLNNNKNINKHLNNSRL